MPIVDIMALSKRTYDIHLANGWISGSRKMQLALICSEIYECVQADRRGHRADIEQYNLYCHTVSDELFPSLFERHIKESVESEMADIALRILTQVRIDRWYPIVTPEFNTSQIDTSQFYACSRNGYSLVTELFDLSQNFASADLSDKLRHTFLIAHLEGIDLLWFIEQRLRYNSLNPRRKVRY